ncbi:MAG: glycerophosphodiester phosphodiesterase [Acidobacteriota bacterium]
MSGAASREHGGWNRLPFLIAHRGYSSLAPENTLAAFERALAAGAEVLECDVQLSRDGVVVVLHDPDLDRTTDGHGPVREMDWEQIHRLDAGYSERFGNAYADQRIPRLEQVLELARGRAQVFVEIKPEAVGGERDGIEARTLLAARRTGMQADIGVLSFAPRPLRRLRQMAPEMPLGLVFRWWRQRRLVEETLDVGADYLVVYAARLLALRHLVDRAHRRELRVGAYVVDSEEHLQALLQLGVDGIATNRVGDLIPGLAAPHLR